MPGSVCRGRNVITDIETSVTVFLKVGGVKLQHPKLGRENSHSLTQHDGEEGPSLHQLCVHQRVHGATLYAFQGFDLVMSPYISQRSHRHERVSFVCRTRVFLAVKIVTACCYVWCTQRALTVILRAIKVRAEGFRHFWRTLVSRKYTSYALERTK